MAAYYNEFDPYAAQWLRNLIAAGRIAPGIVDERSIEDVTPADLAGFTQCHFFAGVGVWSLALRKAGWPDDRPVWTGSCPCQPFSTAGAGAGFADPRHIWPSFAWLIRQCSPAVVFGEQVASKAVEPWVDLVHADLEALGYAFGAVPFPSAGVGAPHIRDRLFWVADGNSLRREGLQRESSGGLDRGNDQQRALLGLGSSGEAGRMADAQLQQRPNGQTRISPIDESAGRLESAAAPAGLCCDMRMADAEHPGHGRPESHSPEPSRNGEDFGLSHGGHFASKGQPAAGPTNGLWRDADWLLCRDGKWRPVRPGSFPLANGAASRVGRLRAYGNAINAEAAQEFIGSYLDSIDSKQSELDE